MMQTVAQTAPLLAPPQPGRVLEMKFALTAEQVEQVEPWLWANMLPANDTSGSRRGVQVATVCLDTTDLAVYHRERGYSRRKYRVRSYGDAGQVQLECKRKTGGRVRLRTAVVPATDLQRIGAAGAADEWPGLWFGRKLTASRLEPRCLITYDRLDFVARDAADGVAASLDRNMRCWPADGYRLASDLPGAVLSGPHTMLELRYASCLPAKLRRLIGDLHLEPYSGSKYRLAIDTLGICREARNGTACSTSLPA